VGEAAEWTQSTAPKWILSGADRPAYSVAMDEQRFTSAGLIVPPAPGRETRDGDSGAPGARSDETQAVVERFAFAWANPQLERFMELLHPDVLLLQPVTRPIRGRAAARAEFSRLLRWLPDLRGTVDQSAVRDAVALIAWRLAFTLGRQPYELRIIDRLVVSDGLIREREAYYDSLRLMLALLRRPRSWPGYWWYRGFLPGSR